MTKRTMWRGALVGTSLFGLIALGRQAAAADAAPDTAAVLKELHQTNQNEIAAGKLATKSGKSKEVKAFGKTLEKDHTAADKKVTALAKQEKLDLGPVTPADMSGMASDPAFDQKFGQEMLDGHKKAIGDVTEARDKTADAKLKKLLTELLPTLQKHEETAQKIVDAEAKK